MTVCRVCNHSFVARGAWQVLCFPCWKDKQDGISELKKELQRLKNENEKLKTMLKMLMNEHFNYDELMQLIQLCHPDKHGNSRLANEVTKKLLAMRERADRNS